ncbi:MAG: hypothetical protein IJY46_07755 [Lentisphaeria bacterium]|nr:hypothetical protein [Lentisphaeria bacterium]
MPKIPLSNRTPMIEHVRAEAPLTGGGLHLRYYGDGGTGKAISDAAKKIGDAATGFGNSVMQYAIELQDTEDKLAAAEDRALFKASSGELNAKLANNPAVDDKTRTEWVSEWQQDYQEKRKDIVARMSKKFRDRHDVDMQSMQQSFASDRLRIINAAKTQRLLDEGDTLYRTFCDRGQFDEAEKLVRDNTGKLWSADTASRLLTQDLPMRREYLEAKTAVEADPDAALDRLQDQKQFTFLPLKNRDQLIRYAKAKSAEKTVDFVQDYIAQINSGTLSDTVEDLKTKFEEGKISRSQFNAAVPYVRKYHEDLRRSQSQEEQQKLRLEQLRADDAAGAFVYKTLYAADGSKLTYSAAALAVKRLELMKLCGGSTSLLDKYMPKLNSALAPEAVAPGRNSGTTSKKPDFWKTPDGEVINKWITAVGKDNNAYRWDPDGSEDSDDWSKEQQMAHHLRMELQYRELAEQLYAKYGDTKDVIDTLIWARKQLNDGTISSFLQWRETNFPLIDKKLGYDRAPKKSNRPKAGDK